MDVTDEKESRAEAARRNVVVISGLMILFGTYLFATAALDYASQRWDIIPLAWARAARDSEDRLVVALLASYAVFLTWAIWKYRRPRLRRTSWAEIRDLLPTEIRYWWSIILVALVVPFFSIFLPRLYDVIPGAVAGLATIAWGTRGLIRGRLIQAAEDNQ